VLGRKSSIDADDLTGLVAMETDVNQGLEDYWNEYKVLQHTKLPDGCLEEAEDYGSRSCDGKFRNLYKYL
jgi:hypothetical protein